MTNCMVTCTPDTSCTKGGRGQARQKAPDPSPWPRSPPVGSVGCLVIDLSAIKLKVVCKCAQRSAESAEGMYGSGESGVQGGTSLHHRIVRGGGVGHFLCQGPCWGRGETLCSQMADGAMPGGSTGVDRGGGSVLCWRPAACPRCARDAPASFRLATSRALPLARRAKLARSRAASALAHLCSFGREVERRRHGRRLGM